jgi:hypothetical protein
MWNLRNKTRCDVLTFGLAFFIILILFFFFFFGDVTSGISILGVFVSVMIRISALLL